MLEALVQDTFTGLYPLDDSPRGKLGLKMALETSGKFVMKPQREGGGNNIYGERVKSTIEKLTFDERQAFILMERIEPPMFDNVMMRDGKGEVSHVICELGIYGTWISDGPIVYLNQEAGHLLRTKRYKVFFLIFSADSDEGGVAAGFGVLDSPLLI